MMNNEREAFEAPEIEIVTIGESDRLNESMEAFMGAIDPAEE